MPVLYNWLVAAFLVGAVLVCVIFFVRNREKGRLAIELSLVLALVVVLYAVTGFPFPSSRIAFGGSYSAELALTLMFLGVIFGIVASVFFNADSALTLEAFIKPLMVAPIVTLPLIGSMQGGSLSLTQIASIAFLSFQNGFFWREVLSNVRVK